MLIIWYRWSERSVSLAQHDNDSNLTVAAVGSRFSFLSFLSPVHLVNPDSHSTQ